MSLIELGPVIFGGNEKIIDFLQQKICWQEDAVVLGIIIIIF